MIPPQKAKRINACIIADISDHMHLLSKRNILYTPPFQINLHPTNTFPPPLVR
jgi:hypothetical protein